MKSGDLKVLLIEEGPGNFSGILRRLDKTGCRCQFAKSYAEARSLVAAEIPELVLSVIPPRDNAMSSLTAALAGTRASVFYAHPVEDSCWWLPALRNGLPCFGAPALRPGEFTSLLDRLVEEIRQNRSREPVALEAIDVRAHAGAIREPEEPVRTHRVTAA